MPADSRRRAFRVGGVLVLATVAGVVATLIIGTANVGVSPWYLAAVAPAVTALILVVRDLYLAHVPSATVPHGAEPDRVATLRLLDPHERRIAAAARERHAYVVELQPVLLQLVRERLRQRPGFDLDAALRREPGTVRHLLGEELYAWLTTTQRTGPALSPSALQRLVTAIERLR